MHFILAIRTAFSLWMLADAYQRRAGTYWYFIVLLPFGELAYFFMVKIHDPEFRGLKRKLLTRRVTLAELEYRARNSPSLHNQLQYGQALHDAGEFDRSLEILEGVAQKDRGNKAAMHGIALCLMQLKKTADAVQVFEQLVEKDLGYSDFSPCADLASAYWELHQRELAIALLERVVAKSKRISHRVELARYLQQCSQDERARKTLEEVLIDYRNSPGYLRRLERPWAREAKKLLKSARPRS